MKKCKYFKDYRPCLSGRLEDPQSHSGRDFRIQATSGSYLAYVYAYSGCYAFNFSRSGPRNWLMGK